MTLGHSVKYAERKEQCFNPNTNRREVSIVIASNFHVVPIVMSLSDITSESVLWMLCAHTCLRVLFVRARHCVSVSREWTATKHPAYGATIPFFGSRRHPPLQRVRHLS